VNGTVMLIIYVVLFGAIFYFLAIRPQRKQKAQHQEMVSMLKRGDEVLTIGGMYGTVKKVGPDWVVIEVAPRTQIRFLKRAISSITQPLHEEEDEYVEEEEYYDDETDALEAGEEYEEYDEEGEYAEEGYEGEDAVEEEETVEDEETYDALPEESEEIPAAPAAPAAKGAKKGKAS